MSYFLRLFVIGTLTTGPWGFFGAVFAWILTAFVPKKEISKEYTERILKKRGEDKDIALTLQKLSYKKTERLSDRLDILSYKEILASADEFQKINLIGMLSFNPTKENVSLIKSALDDNIEMVRILASTSLQKMDAMFVSKILELKEVDGDGERFYLTVAQIYDDYVYSGLIAKENESFYISKMLEYYKKGYESAKSDEAAKKYIRALIRFGKIDEASSICKGFGEQKQNETAIKFWMAEICFKQKDFDGVKNILASVNHEKIGFEPYKKSIGWWVG